MYGLLLENLSTFIKLQWGETNWDAVRRHAGLEATTFGIHHVYAETLIPRLARSAVQVLGVEEKEFFDAMGVYFVEFVGQFGYDQVMSVLGRHMRDFLNGLDNLHEYLKFSFPRMRAPSFFCENETVDGLTLHYRSKRRGFVYYAMGQIKQVAKHFYDTDCFIELRSEELDGDTMHVVFQLTFDNRAYIKTESLMNLFRDDQLLPFRTSMLFELFPFCIVFSEDMVIRQTGQSLYLILKDLVGQVVTDSFDIIRPLIAFTFSSILERRNNIFELITVAKINEDEFFMCDGSMEEEESGTNLRLKGQMLYMNDWQSMMFLATPVMPDLNALLAAGLFINDLSLHDCSRDLILAGTQQSVEMKLALEHEQIKSKRLEESMKKLDEEMRRTDDLLYQMIPRLVADRIRSGENPVDTCQVYDVVSILFSDVVTFTEICSRINPMQVVSMLNHMYSLFDQLSERNGVYKVETIGDAYMVVSGAPNQEVNHAERICDMALDMIDASMGIFDPSRDGEHLNLRVGIHSGNVVAGVVGLKMPRWCLFGDAVNTSSRMESTSVAGRIQISEKTQQLLPGPYKTEFRGEIAMKGKGNMPSYWLIGREGRIPLIELQCNTFSWAAPVMNIYTGPSDGPDAPGGRPTFGKEKTLSIVESEAPSLTKSYGRQESITKTDGHLPHLTHQNTSEKMNLDAAKQAVNKALMKRQISKAAEKEEEKTAVKNEAAAAALKINDSVEPKTKLETKEKPRSRRGSENIKVVPAEPIIDIPVTEKDTQPTVNLRKKSDAGISGVDTKVTPKIAKQENINIDKVPGEEQTEIAKIQASTLVESIPVPTKDVVNTKPDKKAAEIKPDMKDSPELKPSNQPRRASGTVTVEVTKSEEDPPPITSVAQATASLIQSRKPSWVETMSNSIQLSDQAQNQTQDNYLLAKATSLRRNSIAKIQKNEVQNDVNNVGSKLKDENNIKDEKKGRQKETILKRIRGNKNKVALLTSETMTKIGCTGFGTKPKQIISQTCSLL